MDGVARRHFAGVRRPQGALPGTRRDQIHAHRRRGARSGCRGSHRAPHPRRGDRTRLPPTQPGNRLNADFCARSSSVRASWILVLPSFRRVPRRSEQRIHDIGVGAIVAGPSSVRVPPALRSCRLSIAITIRYRRLESRSCLCQFLRNIFQATLHFERFLIDARRHIRSEHDKHGLQHGRGRFTYFSPAPHCQRCAVVRKCPTSSTTCHIRFRLGSGRATATVSGRGNNDERSEVT